MKTLFSTKSVAVRDRFEFWHSVCQEALVEHHSAPRNPRTFEGTLQLGSVADIGLVACSVGAMNVIRTSRHASNGDPNELLLGCVASGVMRASNGDGVLTLEQGDVALIDPRQAYSLDFSDGCRQIVAKVARRDFIARLGAPLETPILKLPRQVGLNGLLSNS